MKMNWIDMGNFTKLQMLTIIPLLLVISYPFGISELENPMDDWQHWTLEKLEKAVSSSRWNPTKHEDEVIREYVDVCIKETERAKKTVPHEINISYGPKNTQKFDVYGTDLPEDAPTFIWIHGGYWQEGSKDMAALVAVNLHRIGVRNVVLGYTLAPKATLSQIEQEVIQAVRKVINRYPSSKIFIGGHSAGAQLTAMLLHFTDTYPEIYKHVSGMVLVSGLYDLRTLVPTYVNSALHLTLHEAEKSSPLRIGKINAKFAKRKDFQISVIVGNHDSPLFQVQAQEYYSLLKKTFPKVSFWKSPMDDHFTLVEKMSNLSSESGNYFFNFIQGAVEKVESRSGANPTVKKTLIGVAAGILALF